MVTVRRSAPPGLARTSWLVPVPGQPRVTERVGGLFTTGNRNSQPTAPTEATRALYPEYRESPGGFLGMPKRSLGFKPNQPKPEAKYGRKCPGCWVTLPLVGHCASCWDD